MRARHYFLIFVGAVVAGWGLFYRPFPPIDGIPPYVIMDIYYPNSLLAIKVWYYTLPGVAVSGGGLILLSLWHVYFEKRGRRGSGGAKLPAWPLDSEADGPAIVVGEVHHPVAVREVRRPSWLTIPERGLYTGVAIFGAVGSGKTSACMHPFASQLLGWRARDPEKRAAALVLEVKGDFCHDIRRILTGAGRGSDYVELSMDGRWYWNPLAAPWLDSYSLAYTISSLLNQLFGKGKDPFWQQAYTNLVRWIIELHRALPGEWVTLRDVYRCTISPALLAAKIREAEQAALRGQAGTLQITREAFANAKGLDAWKWTPIENTDYTEAEYSVELRDKLIELKVNYEEDWPQSKGAGQERLERVWAVQRWYEEDWMKLDNKVRSSVVEGVAVFLSMFDLPEVAKVFCPDPPPKWSAAAARAQRAAEPGPDDEITSGGGVVVASIKRHLPPMDELIESGKVLALNMPVGTNPALARAIGVMLKNAWLQTLLRRPAWMKESPERYFRPAVFICDEYQSFASVGEDDPSGDEKAFALTRQCRVIPIVATQSISSLRSVLGSSEAWRTLLQTLRTRIFLSLSDDASARIASELCGQVSKIKGAYTLTESAKRAGISPLSGRAGGGGGNVGASKSFQERREAVFHPRDFALLSNCQAICLPYDGAQSLEPRRVYLKPHYLPRDLSYWRQLRDGRI